MEAPLTPSTSQLHDALKQFLSEHRVFSSGLINKRKYVFHPDGFHYIDLDHYEQPEIAPLTCIEIEERGEMYLVTVTQSRFRIRDKFLTPEEVVQFIDKFSWSNYSDDWHIAI